MYTTTVWNQLHALDARTRKELWRYDPQVNRSWMRYMCCGPSNRGPALWKGRVYEAAIEGRVSACVTAYDAATGKQLWRFWTVPGDPAKGFESDAMAMAFKTWNGDTYLTS